MTSKPKEFRHTWWLFTSKPSSLDLSTCRYNDSGSKSCMRLYRDLPPPDHDTGRMELYLDIEVPTICNQCFVRLVGYQSIWEELDYLFHIASCLTNDKRRFVSRKDLFHRHLNNLCKWKKNQEDEDFDGEGVVHNLWKTMHIVTLKRRFVRWLIEIGNGLYFKEFIIDQFVVHQLDPYDYVLPIISHLLKFRCSMELRVDWRSHEFDEKELGLQWMEKQTTNGSIAIKIRQRIDL